MASPPEASPIEAAADSHATVRPATYPDDRPSLLLVEDHPTNRQVIQIILGDLVKLDMACDGAQGLQAVQRSSYDLILMDMQMPVMDGLAAVSEIRSLETLQGARRTPIIMLTANALPEHIAKARAAGADLHLAKPFTSAALFEALNTVMTIGETETVAA
jgi:CheY-like chemotaxis protein